MWDYVIIVLVFFTIIMIPLEIAWKPHFSHQIGYMIVDYLFDLAFLLDIFITMRTTIIKYGEEIVHPHAILKQYVLNLKFGLDILCILQLHLFIANDGALKILKILKAHALMRFTQILRELNLKEEVKAMIKIVFYFWVFIMYMHVIACCWYYIISFHN
jgi:hypothetical protein